MKKRNVIVFDVDNTIIKGNLTFYFLRFLAKEKIYFFYKCVPVLLSGTFLVMRSLPKLVKKILLCDKNFKELDESIGIAIQSFYEKIFALFEDLKLIGPDLEKKAKTLFTQKFLEKTLYKEAVSRIAHHLKNSNVTVVLLSGSPQEFINVLQDNLRKKFKKMNIDCENRFFARGTKIEKKSEILTCVGSSKLKVLKELFQKKGGYSLQFTYSDNSFMADLPLITKSAHGGALITEKNSLYQALPNKLLKRLVFLPEWEKY